MTRHKVKMWNKIIQQGPKLMALLMTIMAIVTAVSVSAAWDVIKNNSVIAVSGAGDATPVGSSIKGYWTNPPQGYLLEDGSAVSRTIYANLFSVIGTTFGAGDGSTTFNLPNSLGRVGVNRSSSEVEFDVMGETTYGEKTHQLSVTEMPSHEHGIAGYTLAWGAGGGNVHFRETEGSTDWIQAVGGSTLAGTNGMYTCSGCGDWIDTTNVGSSAAHNNLQPYIVALRVIKY